MTAQTRWTVALPVLLSLALSLAAGVPAAPRPALADSAQLELVGRDSIGDRGLNAALALAGPCAYVGSRGQAAVAILDVSDPTRPHQVGSIEGRPGTTARELRAVEDAHLLVVMSYALTAGGANRFDIYGWQADCARPHALGSYVFAAGAPHEFFLWRDPSRPARVLLFTAMFGSAGQDLQVIDISDPSRPRQVATWEPPAGALHSVSVDPAGRAYLSLWRAGLAVADAGEVIQGRPNPQLRLLSGAGSFLPPAPGGNVHSAVVAPDGRFVLVTDERYPPGCPYGPARTVDVRSPELPRALARLGVPENDLQACRAAAAGTYTSHNATLTRSLAFISWYSSGLQVFDVTDPEAPSRLVEYRPAFGTPRAMDLQLGSTSSQTWSYPVLRDGLVYVADINQGLVVLRYHGPHEAEVGQAGFGEGNSNLTAPSSAASDPSRASTSGQPVSQAGDLAPRQATVKPAPGPLAGIWPALAVLAALSVLAAAVAAVVAAAFIRRRA